MNNLNSYNAPRLFTLVDLLQQKSQQNPQQVIYTFLTDGEQNETKITLSELEYRSKCIAVKLLAHCKTGDRALIIYEPGIDYIAAFFGCLCAGVIAVPIYPPRLNKSIHRVEKTYIDSQAKTGLTTGQILARITAAPEELNILKSGVWINTDDLSDIDVKQWTYPGIHKDSLAFLQYTSGSTGDPKGVMITHWNLLENLKAIYRSFAMNPSDTGVIWLPPYHDMGLIGGILEPLYAGVPVVLIPPVHFLQKPLRWLQAITKYQGTISGGPNFAYELCCWRISAAQCQNLNLSSWKLAFNGAEMVRSQTIENFYQKFKSCGFRKEVFYSCYGLAEATLLVTGGPPGNGVIVKTLDSKALEQNQVITDWSTDTIKKELVGSGQTVGEQQIAIIHPDTLSPCPPKQIGEICIKGDCIAKGYWHKPEETEKTFQLFLNNFNDGPYMRTGDLGFIYDDDLFVVGRLKDLIIINGKNYYPTDIESSIAHCHPAIKSLATAAFSVDWHDQENLVIVTELDRNYLKTDDFSELITKITTTISEEYELAVYAIVLIKTSTLDKTSSGKIQRFLCKQKFLKRDLDVVYEWYNDQSHPPRSVHPKSLPQSSPSGTGLSKSQPDIESWLIARIASYTGFNAADIDPDLPFANFGMDSVKVLSISGELEDFLNKQLSPTLLYNYPTIRSLSLYLSNQAQTRSNLPGDEAGGAIQADEPIAIIGMACRFPGAENLEEYWELLCAGTDAVTRVPKSRWDIEKFYDPDKETPGKINSVWGGFLNNIDQFDPTFFGIAPKEASFMDPQQRLLLETAWFALENAGKRLEEVKGSKTGVFIGCSQNEYGWYQFCDYSLINTYSATGCALGILANRISYLFDLKGPSITLDTICSSSLISVHLACQSLRNQECNLALAGGINLILTPNTSLGLSKLNLLSDDGRCKVFDSKADGIVRSEGVGIVVLKPLSKALADRDRIYAMIQSSVVNQDGKTNGITAPNGIAQAELLKEAYRKAGIEPSMVHYIETHGTGTILGDPIEANAIGEVVGLNRKEDHPCYIGSVKTNLGHCESIGGLASLIKVALAIKNRTLPPNIHYQAPNPHIDFERGHLKVPLELMPWPYNEPAVAGVSSFAFGGTNCHIVLMEPESEAIQVNPRIARSDQIHLLPISALDKVSLQEQVKSYLPFLENKNETDLTDICYSAGIHKTHFEHRLICLFDSKEDLIRKLSKFVNEETDSGVLYHRQPQNSGQKLIFVYPDSGPDWDREIPKLMNTEPVFSQKMNECEHIIAQQQKDGPISIFPAQKEKPVQDTKQRNLAHFATLVSLTSLWKSWGISPKIAVGTGIGEIAAAYAAGILNLENAVRIIMRFSAMTSNTSKNNPSGDNGAILRQLFNEFPGNSDSSFPKEDAGITFYPLHCHPGKKEPGSDPVMNDSGSKTSPLHDLLDNLAHNENHLLMEIGTKDTLSSIWELPHSNPSPNLLSCGVPGSQFLLQLLGKLYALGYDIKWNEFYQNNGNFVDLPGYCFHKNEYWIEYKGKRITYDDIYYRLTSQKTGISGKSEHPLIGHYLKPAFSSKTHIWELEISLERFPYLTDHRVFGSVVVPSAFLLEMVLAATNQAFGSRYDSYADLHIKLGIFVPNDKPVLVQLVIDETGTHNSAKYRIYSRDSGNWKGWALNAEGKIHYKAPSHLRVHHYLMDRIQHKYPNLMKPEEYYGELQMRKMAWGPAFQGIKELWYQNTEALGKIHLPAYLLQESADYAIHPAVLDAAFQVLMATIPKNVRAMIQDPYLLVKLSKFKLYKKCPPDFWSYGSLRSLADKGRFQGNVKLIDATGELIAEAGGMILQRLGSDGSVIDQLETIEDVFYELQWQKGALTGGTGAGMQDKKVSWLVFAAENKICKDFLELLKARNDDYITIYPGDYFEIEDNGSYRVKAAEKRDLKQLMEVLADQKRNSFDTVVHFWSTDPSIAREVNLATIEKANEMGFMTLTYLVQVLKETMPTNLPRIWLVTQGAISPVDLAPDVTQSNLWGLSRVLSIEHPEIWGGIIDLERSGNTGNPGQILLENILRPQEDRQLAIYQNQCFVPRVVKSMVNPNEKTEFLCRPDGTYLITGGYGGLGFIVAKWLADKGAKFIVLTGRRSSGEYSPEIMEEIERLKQNGIHIKIMKMDVAIKEQVSATLSELKQSNPPLRGIIHTAGWLEDKLLLDLNADSYHRVTASKVIGSWILHEETKDIELDFFVLFSSLVSFLGQPGQASYAAANTFMDFLAHYRRKLGLPALSINWGPWSEVGMAASLGEKGKAQYSAWGLNYISPIEGVSIMEILMAQKVSPQVATIKANWTQLIYNFSSMQKPTIFSALLNTGYEEALKQASSIQESILEMDAESRSEMVKSFIKKEIAATLGYSESEIDLNLSLTHLGIDSLAALEFRNSIEKAFGVILPLDLLFQDVAVNELACKVIENIKR
jgi:acyl transferase domain-containing protein/acyl-CoA synthetase (AMP-forming)/AMP-acid ligase II/acyl carrier protein